MKYAIIEKDSAVDLERRVNEYIAEGWKPFGSPSSSICFAVWNNAREQCEEHEYKSVYIQAMTRVLVQGEMH